MQKNFEHLEGVFIEDNTTFISKVAKEIFDSLQDISIKKRGRIPESAIEKIVPKIMNKYQKEMAELELEETCASFVESFINLFIITGDLNKSAKILEANVGFSFTNKKPLLRKYTISTIDKDEEVVTTTETDDLERFVKEEYGVELIEGFFPSIGGPFSIFPTNTPESADENEKAIFLHFGEEDEFNSILHGPLIISSYIEELDALDMERINEVVAECLFKPSKEQKEEADFIGIDLVFDVPLARDLIRKRFSYKYPKTFIE